ncbi:MAG: type VI secretion system lipoprotein TssJ [Gammaproteobacteria bacterium]|nr:MAG: type VI secretion system lipoprotein TssJ [Gammaproteobacteria bacterium]
MKPFILHRRLGSLLLAATVTLLAACSGPQLKMDLSSSANINMDRENHPLPVVVRVYQLSDITAFEQASFKDLWRNDIGVLGDQLLVHQEIVIDPASQKTLTIKRHPRAAWVGVMAVFRSPIDRNWKDWKKLSTSWVGRKLSSSIDVRLQGNRIEIYEG